VALVASGLQCATLCAVPFVSSDPDAWMRPYYEAIASREGFAHLAIPTQFATLVNAIAQDHPAWAAKLRDIDDLPSQRAILGSFTRIVYPRPAQREIELWRVTKDSRELRCIATICRQGSICASWKARSSDARNCSETALPSRSWRRSGAKSSWPLGGRRVVPAEPAADAGGRPQATPSVNAEVWTRDGAPRRRAATASTY
jgi:hypothetical protein